MFPLHFDSSAPPMQPVFAIAPLVAAGIVAGVGKILSFFGHKKETAQNNRVRQNTYNNQRGLFERSAAGNAAHNRAVQAFIKKYGLVGGDLPPEILDKLINPTAFPAYPGDVAGTSLLSGLGSGLTGAAGFIQPSVPDSNTNFLGLASGDTSHLGGYDINLPQLPQGGGGGVAGAALSGPGPIVGPPVPQYDAYGLIDPNTPR